MNDPVTVSVAVIFYNHQNYIRQNLDSILSQKTDFKYEIIAYDDASTDETPVILKQYEEKYPEIIKAVCQTENQYSKGVLTLMATVKRATGEYIAICEGDDFWTDEYKLQKQVDYMRAHPECAMCCHAAKRYSEEKKMFVEGAFGRPKLKNGMLTAEEIIEGGGGYLATNTILYKREYDIGRPDYITSASVSDYPLMFYLASRGTVYYIDECMSAYRVDVPGSWSAGMKDIEKKEKHIERVNKMLREADEYHKQKYHTSFEKRIIKNSFEIAYLRQDWDEMLKRKYSAVFRETLGESQAKLRFKMKLRKLLGKK